MSDVEPRFEPVSRIAVKKKLNILHEEERDKKLKEIADLSFKPYVTLNFWTGRMVGVLWTAQKKLSNHNAIF